MFDQNRYLKDYMKDTYKTFKVRVRKDNPCVIKKLSEVDSLNAYVLRLIQEDLERHRVYHYINGEIEIDFELSKTMQELIKRAEESDYIEDYETYANLADDIDVRAKNEVSRHQLSEGQWNKLVRRYRV